MTVNDPAVPGPRWSTDNRPLTLAELDRIDPAAADNIREQQGWPRKHRQPAKKAAAGRRTRRDDTAT